MFEVERQIFNYLAKKSTTHVDEFVYFTRTALRVGLCCLAADTLIRGKAGKKEIGTIRVKVGNTNERKKILTCRCTASTMM